jgi:hypothetical protein
MLDRPSLLKRLRFVVCLCAALGYGLRSGTAEDRSIKIIEGMLEPMPGISPPAAAATPAIGLKAKNLAGVTVEVLPGVDLQVGTKIAFRDSTRRPGNLLLVDIDASDKLTHIYPNVLSLARATGGAVDSNLIEPGSVVTIPDANNPLARFEFLAAPPLGVGMVVAILSDISVQMIDLPDLLSSITGQQAAVDYFHTVAQSLKIASVDKQAS